MTDEQLLDQIARVREQNNVNWMELLKIALIANPKATKEVLGKILIMDLQVSRLMREMSGADWKPRNLDRTVTLPSS